MNKPQDVIQLWIPSNISRQCEQEKRGLSLIFASDIV